ncbi:YL1 nuclear protein-domain-containing protein [Paraphysoderma sedebokerense]|nr:YL1 nuclear protein-domain-containing protein [Paraphysoderma sedebokerense]
MSLVTSRSKRATAGNRMRDLLETEVEVEEMFMEVEEDEEFVGKEEEDIFDSDFETESEDENKDEVVEADEDEFDKKKRKKTLDFLKKPAKKPKTSVTKERKVERKASLAVSETSVASTTEQTKKKKLEKINWRDYQPVRQSYRASTVKVKEEADRRQREREEKRAALPKKEKQVTRKMTQAELLAEAAITEQINIASLENWRAMELEKKKNVNKKKKGIQGPIIRYLSYPEFEGRRILIEEIKEVENRNKDIQGNQMDLDDENPPTHLKRNVICPITGLPAKYLDPQTKIPYANIKAFRIIRSLIGDTKYSSPSSSPSTLPPSLLSSFNSTSTINEGAENEDKIEKVQKDDDTEPETEELKPPVSSNVDDSRSDLKLTKEGKSRKVKVEAKEQKEFVWSSKFKSWKDKVPDAQDFKVKVGRNLPSRRTRASEARSTVSAIDKAALPPSTTFLPTPKQTAAPKTLLTNTVAPEISVGNEMSKTTQIPMNALPAHHYTASYLPNTIPMMSNVYLANAAAALGLSAIDKPDRSVMEGHFNEGEKAEPVVKSERKSSEKKPKEKVRTQRKRETSKMSTSKSTSTSSSAVNSPRISTRSKISKSESVSAISDISSENSTSANGSPSGNSKTRGSKKGPRSGITSASTSAGTSPRSTRASSRIRNKEVAKANEDDVEVSSVTCSGASVTAATTSSSGVKKGKVTTAARGSRPSTANSGKSSRVGTKGSNTPATIGENSSVAGSKDGSKSNSPYLGLPYFMNPKVPFPFPFAGPAGGTEGGTDSSETSKTVGNHSQSQSQPGYVPFQWSSYWAYAAKNLQNLQNSSSSNPNSTSASKQGSTSTSAGNSGATSPSVSRSLSLPTLPANALAIPQPSSLDKPGAPGYIYPFTYYSQYLAAASALLAKGNNSTDKKEGGEDAEEKKGDGKMSKSRKDKGKGKDKNA